MRKLKLESVEVESFPTTQAAPRQRGTLHAHQQYSPSIETYDVQECGDTRYFDCTFGCSVETNCGDTCGPTGYDCA